MKRILTIQDISCVGKCSLTVALPVLSACGLEACVLPSAVLSSHTAFPGATFRDLTEDIAPIVKHWKKEGFKFDGIYTGYLGSFEQIDLMKEFFADFKTEDNIILVDPAMADNGKLYYGFDMDFVKNMAALCGGADIIVPENVNIKINTFCLFGGISDKRLIKETDKAAPVLNINGFCIFGGADIK